MPINVPDADDDAALDDVVLVRVSVILNYCNFEKYSIIFELLSYRSNPLLRIDHVGSCIRSKPLLWIGQTIFIWWYL